MFKPVNKKGTVEFTWVVSELSKDSADVFNCLKFSVGLIPISGTDKRQCLCWNCSFNSENKCTLASLFNVCFSKMVCLNYVKA